MKLIFILSDTFRRDHLGAYGNKKIHTPNLDRLAGMSNVFTNSHIASFPTLPNRRDMYLGVGDGPDNFNPWRGISDDEVTLAERVGEKNIPTMMITDVANSVSNGKNFFKGFESYHVNRGQEGDNYWSDYSVPLEFQVEHKYIRYTARRWHQVLMNMAHRKTEDDWFSPGTFKKAGQWIEQNHHLKDFMLWVETFDPHEPFDPPQWYIDMYDPGYTGRVFIAPSYGIIKEMGLTKSEVNHIHARYCAQCTMVDASVGRLIETLEKTGIMDDVAIVFTSDHGTYMGLDGDAGLLEKATAVGENGMCMSAGRDLLGEVRRFPMRQGVTRLPLFIKMPHQKKGNRITRITQPWDITPTVLDMFNIKSPPEFLGESLLPVIAGKKMQPRPYAYHGSGNDFARPRQISNSRWSYTYWTDDVCEPYLIDLKNNPLQNKNVRRKNVAICKKLHTALAKFDGRIPSWPEVEKRWF